MFSWLTKKSRQTGAGNVLYQCKPDLGRAPVLITLFAAESHSVETAIKRHAGARSYLPVFVTSDTGHAPLFGVGAIAEYLPSADVVKRFADAGNWDLYLTERWRLLIAKWRPKYTARYGLSFDEYLDLCRNHASLTSNKSSAAKRTEVPS